MTDTRVSLMDVHGALSHLVFAVKQCLEPLPVDVEADYNNTTYLSLLVSCRGKDVQKIADRLNHGVLQGEYDYRFRVAYSTGCDPNEWTWVRAYPDLMHDHRRLTDCHSAVG